MAKPLLVPKDMRAHMRALTQPEEMGFTNRTTQQIYTQARTLVWTSQATLTTDAMTPFYPMFNGRIVGIRLNVAGAPSGAALTSDFLLDGVTAFPSSNKPTIPAGQLFGYRSFVTDRASFQYSTKMQFQITTISSATGPMVAAIEYLPD